MSPAESRGQRQRSTRAHQCPACRQFWALQLIDHPAGFVLRCRYCRTVRRLVVLRTQAPTLQGD